MAETEVIQCKEGLARARISLRGYVGLSEGWLDYLLYGWLVRE